MITCVALLDLDKLKKVKGGSTATSLSSFF